MSNSRDQDAVRKKLINHRERKSGDEYTAEVLVTTLSGLGVRDDPRGATLELVQEFIAEAGYPRFVKPRRLVHLLLC